MWSYDPLTWCLRVGLLCAVATGVAWLAWALGRVTPVPAFRYGVRGRNRERSPLHRARALEALGLYLAGVLRLVLPARWRSRTARLLTVAGEPWGLDPDELAAWCVVSGLVFALLGASLFDDPDAPWWTRSGLTCLGVSLPLLRVHNIASRRALRLERSLPAAMDLCVLCMGAGADFPSALSFSVRDLAVTHAVCAEELRRVLEELRLGRTRAEALSAFSERTDSRSVRDFVASLQQSEAKGTPLVDVLTLQADALRARRSVQAEESAARAQVKMMVPMLLLVVSLLLIVLGPLIVNGMGL